MSVAAVVLGISIVALWIASAAWVFADAEQNSSQSAGRWGAVVLLFGLAGALIYVYVGRDRTRDRRSAYE